MANPAPTMRTEIEIVKKELAVTSQSISKIDEAIQRVVELQNTFAKMVAIHEHRLESNEKNIDWIKTNISTTEIELEKKVNKVYTKIEELKIEMKAERESKHAEVQAEREKNHREVMKTMDKIMANQNAMNDRINDLEKWRWYVIGAAMVVGFALSVLPWSAFF